MKKKSKDQEHASGLQSKLFEFFQDKDDLMSIFSTVLGCCDLLANHIIESDAHNLGKLSFRCKYGLLQAQQMLWLVSSILRDEVNPGELDVQTALTSSGYSHMAEGDFEKRFVLLVKLCHAQLKKEGKI